jgi:hypothetical protein
MVMQFRHIILFQFKPALSEQEIENIFTAIGALQKKIAGIRAYSWGKNQWVQPSTPQIHNYDYCFVMDFDSKQSRDAYQMHPDHLELVNTRIAPSILSATVFDYSAIDSLLEVSMA